MTETLLPSSEDRSRCANGRAEDNTRRNSLKESLGLDVSVSAKRRGLRLPTDLSFDSWQRIGDQLSVIADSSAWWLADWLVYGEESFPDRYRMAIGKTSLSYKTLRNYAWIARKFPMSRRRDTLSLQHHAEVAALSEQEQETWLTRAENEGWPQSRLRKEIQASRTDALRPQRITVTVTVQISSEQEQQWKAAAEVASIPLPEWIALTLDRAATQVGNAM